MAAERSPRELVDARIDHIADLMSRGMWMYRISAKKLADEWGLTVRSVQDYSKQAWQRIRESRGDLLEQRDNTVSKLEALAIKAEIKGQLRTAVAALSSAAEISGSKAPQSTIVDVRVTEELNAALDRIEAVRHELGEEHYALVKRAVLGEIGRSTLGEPTQESSDVEATSNAVA